MSTLLRHLALLTFGAACSLAYDAPPEPERLLSRIAFGSCNSPLELTPVWESIGHRRPDAWIWLGDTVYADSPTPEGPTPAARARVALDRLPQLYARQLALPAYATLRQRARILGTWDDHDYGMNDLGADWIGREEAQRHFLDFYGEPAGSPRRQRPGIYSSYRFGPPGRVVQVILLDTRYFRSPLRRGEFREADWVDGRRGPYVPSEDPNATVLGAAQWAWLEEVLRQPAELRLLVSSIQVIPDDHRFEKWGNFPHERRRLLRLLANAGNGGAIILSGDRHAGELSQLDPAREPAGRELDPGFPLLELTSSALTRSSPTTFSAQLGAVTPKAMTFRNELNRHRLGSLLPYNHFGLITIDWENGSVALALHLDHGEEVLRHRIALTALRRSAP